MCLRHIFLLAASLSGTNEDFFLEGAKKLGVSVRSVQRLFKTYQEEGLAALTSTNRADKGKHRISEFWQDFIIKTYTKLHSNV